MLSPWNGGCVFYNYRISQFKSVTFKILKQLSIVEGIKQWGSYATSNKVFIGVISLHQRLPHHKWVEAL